MKSLQIVLIFRMSHPEMYTSRAGHSDALSPSAPGPRPASGEGAGGGVCYIWDDSWKKILFGEALPLQAHLAKVLLELAPAFQRRA
jgi:hypothetical protein